MLAVLVVGIAFVGGGRGDPVELPPPPTPPPIITAEAGTLETVPKASAEVIGRTRTELTGALTDIYERAFLPPLPPPESSPTPEGTPPPPTPIPRAPAADYFLDPARAALDAADGLFAPSPSTTIRQGRLSFSGVGTLDGDQPNAFLLEVSFEATGERAPPYDRPTPAPTPTPTPELRLTQEGLLYLVRTKDGWRVAGFDLSLGEEVEVGRAAIAAARWMP